MDTVFLAAALLAFFALIAVWLALPASPEPSRVPVARRIAAEA